MGITKISAMLLIAISGPVSAAVKYWDINGATPGAGGATPAGTWDQGTTANWSLSSAGDVATSAFVSGDAAIFSAGNDASGNYTINVSGLVNPSSGMIIKDGSVTMGGSGSIGVAAGIVTVSNGATLIYGVSSKFLVSAGNALILDNGSVKITNAVGTALWNATGDFRIGPGGGTIEVTPGGVATYTGVNGITMVPGTVSATVTKSGAGEFRAQTCAFTRLTVNQGLWRIPGNGLETGFGAVPVSFAADALTLNGGAVGTSANLVTPATRGIILGVAGGTFVTSASWTIHSVISGPGNLALNGNGFAGSPSQALTLDGNNSYEGTTTLNLGTLSIGNDSNLGLVPALPLSNSIVLAGGTLNASGTFTLHPNRGIRLSASSTIDVSAGQSLSYAGVISAAMNSVGLTKTGAGTLALSGMDTFGGGAGGNFLVTGGTLSLDHDRAGGAGTIVIAPVSAVTLRNSVTSSIVTNPVTLNPGAAGIDILASSGNRFTLSGPFSGVAPLMCGNGEGTVVLAGNNLAWSGGLEHRGGALELGQQHALGTGAFNITGSRAISTVLQMAPGLTGDNAPTNSIHLNTNLVVGGLNDVELAGPINLGAVTRNLAIETSNCILSGPISGDAGLRKSGPGTLLLSGSNVYTGPTLVEAGTLEVRNSNGSASGPGAVTVAVGATLKGQGIVTGAIELNGTIAPGSAVGTLLSGNETWRAGSTYEWQLKDSGGIAGTDWDWLSINGNLAITATTNGKVTLKLRSVNASEEDGLVANFNPAMNYRWPIATATGGINGFDASALGIDVSGFSNSLGGGSFALEVENGTNLVLEFQSNRPPVAADDIVSRPRGVGMKIRKTDLLANDLDFEMGTPIFGSVTLVSTNGGTITTDATYVYYQPPGSASSYDVADRFSYAVSDGFLTATGNVLVNIAADPSNPGVNIAGYALAPDGNISVTFAGVPGHSYLVQAATSLALPVFWQTLTNNSDGGTLFTAGTNGLWTHTDLNATNYFIRFYRTVLP